jgi:GT2 family glycosyltransferase
MSIPVISVIVPVYNSRQHLSQCLRALAASTEPHECIVVDDGSADGSADVAREFGATVIATGQRSGPAYGRNLGAASAGGEVLVFLDSDVCVRANTLARMRAAFDEDCNLAALMGSYDDSPEAQDFLSQYKNLMHHFVHQHARREACTFWAGCGAIRREVFLRFQGFNESYRRPAVEDIELGYRLRHDQMKIVLDPSLQVKHLKKWSFWTLLKSDILDRGVPWTELIFRDGRLPNDLNLHISQRISVALTFLLMLAGISAAIASADIFATPLLALMFLLLSVYGADHPSRRRTIAAMVLGAVLSVVAIIYGQLLVAVCSLLAYLLLLARTHYYSPALRQRRLFAFGVGIYLIFALLFAGSYLRHHTFALLLFALFAGIVILNARFYVLLAARRGRIFAIGAIPFQLLFHFYNGLAFTYGAALYWFRKLRSTSRHDPLPSKEFSAGVRGRPS